MIAAGLEPLASARTPDEQGFASFHAGVRTNVVLLYGEPIPPAEADELLSRLAGRGTSEAATAARLLGERKTRNANAATGLEARDAILLELIEWKELDTSALGLAHLRDRLSPQQHGSRLANDSQSRLECAWRFEPAPRSPKHAFHMLSL